MPDERTSDEHLSELMDFVREIIRPDLLGRQMAGIIVREMISRCRALDKQIDKEKHDARTEIV